MNFKVLEPVYIRSEERSYKVGDEIYLTNEQIEEYTAKLESEGEKFTDYFVKVGGVNEPTESTQAID